MCGGRPKTAIFWVLNCQNFRVRKWQDNILHLMGAWSVIGVSRVCIGYLRRHHRVTKNVGYAIAMIKYQLWGFVTSRIMKSPEIDLDEKKCTNNKRFQVTVFTEHSPCRRTVLHKVCYACINNSDFASMDWIRYTPWFCWHNVQQAWPYAVARFLLSWISFWTTVFIKLTAEWRLASGSRVSPPSRIIFDG